MDKVLKFMSGVFAWMMYSEKVNRSQNIYEDIDTTCTIFDSKK